MILLPVRLHWREKAAVILERKLPSPGKITVKVGEAVHPEDVVGEAEISGGFRKINLAEILGISSSSLPHKLTKKPGDVIYKGEPLAKLRKMLGLRRIVYLSPVDGVVEEINGGEVTIRFAPQITKLSAGFGGVVGKVIPGEKVFLKTTATTIAGVVGAGRERFGSLKVIGKNNEFLLPQHLDSSCVGKIVVGGAIVTSDTIEKALAIGVKGVVTGGINFHETLGWTEGSDIGLTIVALEGYGFHPISEELTSEIGRYEGQYAAISGERAEVLIAVEGETKIRETPAWRELQLGDTVRVVAGSDIGKWGQTEVVSSDEAELPSGLKAKLVTFRYNGDRVAAPIQNLEIIDFKEKK